jgi:hypothetical protein
MEQGNFAASLRATAEAVQTKEQKAEKRAEGKRQRELQKKIGEYVANHQFEFINELTQQAERSAAIGNFTAYIERTEGADEVFGLRAAMEGVRDHFAEQGFDARNRERSNGHMTSFGSDGDEWVSPTEFTIGVGISWGREQQSPTKA